MKENLINLIENNRVEDFTEQVFNNKVCGSGGFYTIPLSADEEKALIHRVLTDKKNNRWYKVMADYMSHYPLSRETIDFLICGIDNPMAVKIICSEYEKHGYVPEQAEQICKAVKAANYNKMFLPLIKVICSHGRCFSYDLFCILGSLSGNLCEEGKSAAQFEELYKKNVHEYRKQNGLLRFSS
jgi:hypothetical protein